MPEYEFSEATGVGGDLWRFGVMEERRSSRKPAKGWLIPAIVVLVVLALSVIALTGGSRSKVSTSATTGGATALEPAQPPSLARRIPGDPLALGSVNAPVVLVEYSEFQCPFCGMFTRNTQPTLIKKYVANGTLRIEWRDFPYLGPESTSAALASRAAANQGKFWQYHDALFAHQFSPNSNHLTVPYLTGIATTLGLDLEKFKTDMNSAATKDAVAADFSEGQSIGVTGTPSFLVNSTPIVGAQPLQVFEQAIDLAAAQATKKRQ